MITLRRPGSRITYVGSSCIEFADDLIGVKDSNNQVFYTEKRYVPGKIDLLYNGQVLTNNDFIESGDYEVTFKYVAPKPEDIVGAIYEIATTSGFEYEHNHDDRYYQKTGYKVNQTVSGSINDVNTVFMLHHTPINDTVQVYLNGLLQEPGSGKDYVISGRNITFDLPPEIDDIILTSYMIDV
jgi:hypothetical protein